MNTICSKNIYYPYKVGFLNSNMFKFSSILLEWNIYQPVTTASKIMSRQTIWTTIRYHVQMYGVRRTGLKARYLHIRKQIQKIMRHVSEYCFEIYWLVWGAYQNIGRQFNTRIVEFCYYQLSLYLLCCYFFLIFVFFL